MYPRVGHRPTIGRMPLLTSGSPNWPLLLGSGIPAIGSKVNAVRFLLNRAPRLHRGYLSVRYGVAPRRTHEYPISHRLNLPYQLCRPRSRYGPLSRAIRGRLPGMFLRCYLRRASRAPVGRFRTIPSYRGTRLGKLEARRAPTPGQRSSGHLRTVKRLFADALREKGNGHSGRLRVVWRHGCRWISRLAGRMAIIYARARYFRSRLYWAGFLRECAADSIDCA